MSDETEHAADTTTESAIAVRPARSKLWKNALRLVILALVAFGIARSARQAVRDFQSQQASLNEQLAELDAEAAKFDRGSAEWRTAIEQRERLLAQRFSWRQIEPAWLIVAGALYLAGLAPCWLFWHATLLAMDQRPRLHESLRAFYLGHLGKYVPGKALVVVLRAGQIRSRRVDTTVAACSVFVETLTMMAVGASLAAAILLLISRSWWLWLLAVGLMLAAGVPTLPPIFRRVVRFLQLKRLNPRIERAIAGLNFRLTAIGWISISAGWMLLGASLWATLRAIPGGAAAMPDVWPALLLLTATVTLAMVAGFLSLLPGGVGVRDYLIITLLAAEFGPVLSLCAAILLRMVWLLSEVLISAILYGFVPRPPDHADPPNDADAVHCDPGLQRS